MATIPEDKEQTESPRKGQCLPEVQVPCEPLTVRSFFLQESRGTLGEPKLRRDAAPVHF